MFLHISVPHPSRSHSRLYNHWPPHLPLPVIVLSVYWLPDVCPTTIDVFCHCGKVKIIVRVVRSGIFLRRGKTLRHSAPETEICGTPGQNSLKLLKPGLSRENRDEWGPYIYMLLIFRNFFSLFLNKVFLCLDADVFKGLLQLSLCFRAEPSTVYPVLGYCPLLM